LGAWLPKKGPSGILIVRLSPGKDGSKVGLDDCLKAYSARRKGSPAPEVREEDKAMLDGVILPQLAVSVCL